VATNDVIIWNSATHKARRESAVDAASSPCCSTPPSRTSKKRVEGLPQKKRVEGRAPRASKERARNRTSHARNPSSAQLSSPSHARKVPQKRGRFALNSQRQQGTTKAQSSLLRPAAMERERKGKGGARAKKEEKRAKVIRMFLQIPTPGCARKGRDLRGVIGSVSVRSDRSSL
jgi:hypothetical protein